jgi:predicted protein tyrosine phosphatase
MEPVHRQRLQRRFGPKLRDKRLGIPDNYEYMDPGLIRILKQRVPPHLRLTPTQTAHIEARSEPHS